MLPLQQLNVSSADLMLAGSLQATSTKLQRFNCLVNISTLEANDVQINDSKEKQVGFVV